LLLTAILFRLVFWNLKSGRFFYSTPLCVNEQRTCLIKSHITVNMFKNHEHIYVITVREIIAGFLLLNILLVPRKQLVLVVEMLAMFK